MAFTCGFYNNLNNDPKYRYNAEQLSSIFDGIISDGMYANYKKAMVVRSSTYANEVIVQPGRAWLMHTWSYNDADLPITAPESELVLDRVDALVIDVNTTPEVRWNEIKWVTGTPSSRDPQRPTLINEQFHKQYPLCYVYRAAGTTTISQENITNMIGTSAFPFVTGLLETIDTDELIVQWEAQFTAWMDRVTDEFDDWFEHIRGQLDEDAAGHLQNEIDGINDLIDGHNIRTMSISEHERSGASLPDGTICLCYEG